MKGNKEEFKKLRQLFKGHKISEPNFGDKMKASIDSSKIKTLNKSLDKNLKSKSKPKQASQIYTKSYKGTPKRWIDFTAYLNSSKKISRNNLQTITKNDISKSNSAISSNQKVNKKNLIWNKQKKVMGKLLTRYDNKTNNIIKQFKKKNIEFRTPRIADRILNSKSANNKSNTTIVMKNKNPASKSNSSFWTKNSSN